jgi:pyruvate ferredoxin oxidoreductase alpha subunit
VLRQLEGSRAVAEAVARCRPQVVAAYPISPQTHIVEALSDLVRTKELSPCEYLMVESEFGALSACIGASAAGARAYTASASQGLLFMAEALPNASGLGLPIVMTVANRAIGAPINIWNDHSDAMSQRDAGWIQLFAESNQEAVDLHVQAFALAERVSLPVMVCMDGFVLTHAFEEIDVPTQEQVDAFLPAFVPRQVLDPTDPVTIGAMVGPEAFTEVKFLAALQQLRALDDVAAVSEEFRAATGRDSGGLVRTHRMEGATTAVVALGSALGSIKDVVDTVRADGDSVGVVGVTCFRPWPADEVREALAGVERVLVVNRAFAVGSGSILGQDLRLTLAGTGSVVYDVVAGLGGRPVTRAGVRALVEDVVADRLDPAELHFLDLDEALVARELARQGAPASIADHLRHQGWSSARPQEHSRETPATQEA